LVDLRVSDWVQSATVSASVQRLYFSRSGTIPLTSSSTYYEYNATERTLYRVLGGVKNVMTENNLVACTLTATRPNSVSMIVDISLTSQDSKGSHSRSFSANLRRYK
jgi:hypothetical protein